MNYKHIFLDVDGTLIHSKTLSLLLTQTYLKE